MNKEIEAPLPPRPAWNADFPIDRVEAQHVLRREFAKYLVFVSGGLAAGSAWVAVRDKLFPHQPITGEHLICKTQDVPVGGTPAFTLPGARCPTSSSILVTMNGVPSSKSAPTFPARCSTSRKKERSNVPATMAGSTRGPALRSRAPRSDRSRSSSWKFGAMKFSSCHRSTKSTALKTACLLPDRLLVRFTRRRQMSLSG